MTIIRRCSYPMLTFLLLVSMLLPAPAQAGQPNNWQPPYSPTLRVYGLDGRDEGPGDLSAAEPGGPLPEDPPYTDPDSIFDPTGTQAPRKDSVTWNPLWMYENETFDENQALGLYQQLYADGNNISEKVWFRHWYEPLHTDKDAITYPSIMEEFTYMLMEGKPLADVPQPVAGPAGRTQFVFPVGIHAPYLNDPFGYGLTTLDADADCRPDIVEIDSEQTLAAKTGVSVDFDAAGVAPLDPDGPPFIGDEVVVFSLAPRSIKIGRTLQFLDHMIQLETVSDSSATLRMWYTGDLLPVDMGMHTAGLTELWTFGTRLPGVQVTASSTAVAGPFFLQVTDLDFAAGTAQLRIGRALGRTYANIGAEGPGALLKRFYVDGHEYNVVAIGTNGSDNFRFITIRTPVPKRPVTLKQHSVHLQHYGVWSWLSVMPPYNYEHFVVKDVQKEQTGRVIGPLLGPLAPILQNKGPDSLPGRVSASARRRSSL